MPHAAPITSVDPMIRRRGSTRWISEDAARKPISFMTVYPMSSQAKLIGRCMGVADDVAAPE